MIECLSKIDSKVKYFLINEDDISTIESSLTRVDAILGTMKIHQLITNQPGVVLSRVLSCFCQHPDQPACSCFQPVKTRFPVDEQYSTDNTGSDAKTISNNDTVSADVLTPIDDVNESMVSKFCFVEYDGIPYPGVIEDVDEQELEVKVMHKIGINRYFWPMIDDIVWYPKSKVLTLLENPPQPVTKRLWKLDDEVWRLLQEKFDI